jgi:hypothetical protein
MCSFLHLHLAEQHRRRYGGDRHASAFRAANAIKHVLLISGGNDAR